MLHEEFSDYILQRMRLTVAEGIPVNPPIWWLDPDDEEALKIDDGKPLLKVFFNGVV